MPSPVNNSRGVGEPSEPLKPDAAAEEADRSNHSRCLSDTVMQEAKDKIARAEEDRANSGLPKLVIPLVEMFLSPDYRLSQFEKDLHRTINKVVQPCGLTSQDTCLGSIDEEIEDGGAFVPNTTLAGIVDENRSCYGVN